MPLLSLGGGRRFGGSAPSKYAPGRFTTEPPNRTKNTVLRGLICFYHNNMICFYEQKN